MMRFFMLVCISLSVFIQTVHARPVSYPGGVTLDVMNNGDEHSMLLHYSPTAKYSLGLRQEYRRAPEFSMTSIQLNNLIKRWNQKDSQANFYIKSGLGYADRNSSRFEDESSVAAFTGIAMDWETRRYFVSYENRYLDAGDIADFFVQKARVGVAPYIANFGELHTWMMLEVEHEPEDEDTWTVTPLLRFFKDVHRVEVGVSNHNDAMFNWTMRF